MPFDGNTNVRTQILLDARSLLARRSGWCQKELHINKNGRDSYCMLGAVSMAARGHALNAYDINSSINREEGAVIQALLLALGSPNNIDAELIVKFNDKSTRRKHEVLSLMDRAMEHLV